MTGFDDVHLTWGAGTYTIPANRVFELVRRIEVILMAGGSTPAFVMLLTNRAPYADIAEAFAEAVSYARALVPADQDAGRAVTREEVFLKINTDMAENPAQGASDIHAAVIDLLQIIAPPMARDILGDVPEKKPTGPVDAPS